MLFQVQIQPKSIKSVSVYGNCGETTQAHYMTMLYNWLMHDIIIIIIIIIIINIMDTSCLVHNNNILNDNNNNNNHYKNYNYYNNIKKCFR